jgi:hypothetical protein
MRLEVNDAMDETGQIDQPNIGERLLEVHLQHYIAKNIQSVFDNPNLVFVGEEVVTPVGRIDILAIESEKRTWVIETKVGTAGRDAVGQLQSYMAAIRKFEEYKNMYVRGVLIAESFDEQCVYALEEVAGEVITLSYKVEFSFIGSEAAAGYIRTIDTGDIRTIDTGDIWTIDIGSKSFHPKNNHKNVFSLDNRYRVSEVLGNNNVEIKIRNNFIIGPYKKIIISEK